MKPEIPHVTTSCLDAKEAWLSGHVGLPRCLMGLLSAVKQIAAILDAELHWSSSGALLLQVAALVVWFSTVAGFYALFIPVLSSVAWQATAAALYTTATIAAFCTYFAVRWVLDAVTNCAASSMQ